MSATERWLPVYGHESSYEVSDLGRVRSVDRIIQSRDGRSWHYRGCVLRPQVHRKGHLYVALHHGDRGHNVWIHHLVLESFVGPRPTGLECRHLNGDPADNRCDNLKWGTASENCYDKGRHGTDHERNKTRCPRKHLLALPNLVLRIWEQQGHRICLACARARSDHHYHAVKRGRQFDIDTAADRHYERIMTDEAA